AVTKLFCESAAEHHIPVEFFDSGKTFITFFEHKIKNFLAMLHEWKARGIEYVFSLDSRDIVFRHPVDIILGKFNAMYDGRVIISKDMSGVAHPLFSHWLPGHLQHIIGKDYEINSDVIAGHVDDLIKVYTNIITHPEWYQIDANKTLSTFITDFPVYPKLCESPYKLNSVCAASILHASRPATREQWEKMCRKKWWEEDEKNREHIPIQIPALEINVAYDCNLKCEYCAHLGRYIKGVVPIEEVEKWITSWKDKLLPCIVRILGANHVCIKIWPVLSMPFMLLGRRRSGVLLQTA
ncbi:MAG: hypothetical protein FWG73_01250, partial [Planctomycetaceae bacterium]|nr:hypothetical protein [Planctomycetaceae bacterium]